ncbi:MAG: roadblock/LC7 domain-containing protein [Tumebacillaceae bacterium]
MSTVFFFFAAAVLLWIIISIIVILGMQNRKQKATDPAASEAHAEETVPSAPPQEDGGLPTVDDKQHMTFNRFLPEPQHDLPWQDQLEQLPGVLGWILVESDGHVIDSSDEDVEEMGATLSKMLGSIGQMSEELGVTPLQLMEWEGPQGSVLVAFPEQAELNTYLVLFLDTETYKNQMRDFLAQLNWESNLKGEFTA